MVRNLGLSKGCRIAEIGVWRGDFSEFLIETFEPTEFHAFDLFDKSSETEMWGQPVSSYFDGMAPKEFYRQRFEGRGVQLELFEGLTSDTLPMAPPSYYDLVYIDAGHDYDNAKFDAAQAVRMAKPDAVIIFNDYTMTDPLYGTPYGVVQAANELAVASDWKFVALGLNSHMFCDVALRRSKPAMQGRSQY